MQTAPDDQHDKETQSPALKALWKRVSEELTRRLGEAETARWFSPINLVRLSEDGLCFSAPNPIYSLWIEENYLVELSEAVSLHLPNHPPIRFEVVEAPAKPANLETSAPKPVAPEMDVEAGLISEQGNGENAEEATGFVLEVEPDDRTQEVEARRKIRTATRNAGLSDAYQFDNFVVGPANRLANAAAKAVAEKPGRTYHPLFIHAGSGLGKTHLLHAIGCDALKRRPKSKIIYITAERFANEYIEALQKNSLVPFRKRFREADMLLIDDVQFLSGKEGMQEEFFHTFNSLTDRHKQIVLASDRPATEIRDIEDRLCSRFQWGMTAEIAMPSMETRIAILRRKREERRAHDVPDWILEYIATHVTANVRAMEGALLRSATLVSINAEDSHEIDEDLLAETLAGFTDAENARQVSVHEIQETVADYLGVTVRDINGRSRTSHLVEARHLAMILAREKTDLSLAEIGKEFGGRDHGTVINACKKMAAKCEKQASTRRKLEYLRRSLATNQSGRSRSGFQKRHRAE